MPLSLARAAPTFRSIITPRLRLCRWLRDECGLLDDAQDRGGNYAADVADMGGHVALAAWLRAEGSGARARSLAVLAPREKQGRHS